MSDTLENLTDEQKAQKIQSLREMITSAESTIHNAKAMLLQFEGKKKAGRKKKVTGEEDGQVIQGTFDGQIMVGTDGKQYPVPANYASKSKLVEGDLLKLTISDEGFFIYKQIGPVPRQTKIGIIAQDATGSHFVRVDEKTYRILLASVTYFKAEPGDEVVIVTGQHDDCQWASIESVLQHNHVPESEVQKSTSLPPLPSNNPKTAAGMLTGKDSEDSTFSDISKEQESDQVVEEDTQNKEEDIAKTEIIDEWTPDIEEIEKEIREEMNIAKSS